MSSVASEGVEDRAVTLLVDSEFQPGFRLQAKVWPKPLVPAFNTWPLGKEVVDDAIDSR